MKTSLAPGSRVVTQYLDKAGLTPYLEKLGFNLVGYGCTTCIGNSGPLPAEIADVVTSKDLAVVAVLSGNRNFEGRIHGQVKASYLASPPLCVAYALAGTVMCDLTVDPLGIGSRRQAGLPEGPLAHGRGSRIIGRLLGVIGSVRRRVRSHLRRRREVEEHAGTHRHAVRLGRRIDVRSRAALLHRVRSAFRHRPRTSPAREYLRCSGDSITTDHISPAGAITANSPAGKYLVDHAVPPAEFNSFGSRRGNHEVMMRGTFGNIRLRNLMTPGVEGPWTIARSERRAR